MEGNLCGLASETWRKESPSTIVVFLKIVHLGLTNVLLNLFGCTIRGDSISVVVVMSCVVGFDGFGD